MKIAQVNLEREYGGAQKHARVLASGLQARGHDVRLYCHPEGNLRREAENAGVPTAPFLVRSQLSLSAPLRLAARLRHDRPDVLHLHTPKDYLCGALAGRLARVPAVVLTRHMLLPLKPLMRHVYRRVDAVACLSEGLRCLLQTQGLDARKLSLTPGAIDLTPFEVPYHPKDLSALRREWNAGPNELLVGCVGRLVPGKGQETLLSAFARCNAPCLRLKLVLLGEGSGRDALEAQAKQLGIRAQVHFADFCHDIPRALAALDIVVVPSTVPELLPLVVMEAMAAQRPVIATRVGGVPELVSHAGVGILVPPGNADALAQALHCLTSDAELREEIALAGAVHARRAFALPRLLDDTQQMYARLFAHRLEP